MCANLVSQTINLKTVCSSSDKDDGGGSCSQMSAHAAGTANVTIETNGNGGEDLVVKKRKTRRGKSKRRNPNPPYLKMSFQQRNKQGQFNRKFRAGHGQALAPFNSNQFLMEDHGDLQELDDKLNKSDGVAGTSMIHSRTRDSSFSVDSDVDFYSSPEDEEEFLTREFDHAYEDLHAERLQSMTKAELIEEYIQLETKVDALTKRLRGKSTNLQSNDDESIIENNQTNDENSYQQEIQKLVLENDELRRENEFLRSGLSRTASSLSSTMDSESDSSTSSCKSGSSSKDTSPNASPKQQQQQTSVNYAECNGFSQQPSPTSV